MTKGVWLLSIRCSSRLSPAVSRDTRSKSPLNFTKLRRKLGAAASPSQPRIYRLPAIRAKSSHRRFLRKGQ
jgi:hypothetical protein